MKGTTGEIEISDDGGANAKILKDKGQAIAKLPGDDIGLTIGLDMKKDFFGDLIVGMPDIGAVAFLE